MDWSRTKSIFIVIFLLINLFLTWQLLDKKSANQIAILNESSIQEILNDNNISIHVELPEIKPSGLHLVGKKQEWTQAMVDVVPLPADNLSFPEPTRLVATLDEPYPISDQNMGQQLRSFVNTYVLNGSAYQFGAFDQDNRRLPLYQQYEGFTTYTYEDGQLVLNFNEKQEIIGYEQSILEFEEHGREHDLMSSLRAIEGLYTDQLLRMNQAVTAIEFGYHSLVHQEGAIQVFAPMWQITVVDEQEGEQNTYLINAIGGEIIQ
ncbi:two-component system regulatory protein YycI [Halalkalibacterium halodurans]|uniref:BH4024 protein n=1 Tax=Halalkalibacterium halodurans (strain ATCC BAA-125 / DSM 18197 / FERM 7344 / JCM 9153 / C-125) TaxID=272558 RepID=Q9K5R4_HALH5|nr:two-component system regulatory protein YycI [Halalkalibacterium halodurans]MDY7224540.1 two-component system regulatory protein YycI [Halalkalibacterium halodurans]MDY7243825.1 two-component system regulatory protein YycI [Halalkalibacterium halodurans]MED4173759.1 two-component system regulatory protein YycI [Halalkalibacterium halodurans]BAB07743.1 BH4024 [Halalkalibacterium halodurans C-125]